MVRALKPTIHIFFQEASNSGKKINLCEDFYLTHSFKRRITKAKIITYANSSEVAFDLAIKAKNKKKSISSNDLFFIVLDTDIKPGKSNLGEVREQITKLQTRYGREARIILSGRSFEVWLCMYDRTLYTKPFTTQANLNKDVDIKYDKVEEWYKQNAERLYNNYESAKNASILSKKEVFYTSITSSPLGVDLIYNQPPYSNQNVLNYLTNLTPFTYMEQLIDCLKQFE